MNEEGKYIHDAYMAMAERHLRRQWIAIILLILICLGTNLAWLHYESQFTDETTTIEATQELTADTGDAIINDGVHIYGESETEDN